MKTTKILLIFVSTLFAILICFSCGKNSGNEPTPPEPEKPKPQIPAWDKSKTATVYFVSKLQNTAIASTENTYKKIGDYLAKKKYHAALIHRTDIDTHDANRINGGAICAFATTKALAYAAHGYAGNTLRGTSILLDSIVAQGENVFAKTLRMKNVPTKINSDLDLPLTTMHIENQSELDAFSSDLSNLYARKLLIIATISSSIYDKLETSVKNSGQKFRLEKVKTTGTTPYTLFILSPKYWLLRETTSENIAETISAYCLQIETNVFY